jgi:hypothetical protein
LKKPESAAQPGQAGPVQVAPRNQSAEGTPNLRRVSFFSSIVNSDFEKGRRRASRPSSGAKGQERREDFLPRIISGTGREYLKVHSARISTKREC